MARASFIIRKDGRYWFQKRFGIGTDGAPSLSSHFRIALRTAEYRVAFSRMMKVMNLMHEYEVQTDISDRADAMVRQMQRYDMKVGAYNRHEMVERRT